MIVWEFGFEDLARTRFAISPMWEAIASLRVALDPARGALHLPWLTELRDGRLRELDLRAIAALVPPRGYIPDFLTPPPTGPLAHIDEDLEQMRATPLGQVRKELGLLLGTR